MSRERDCPGGHLHMSSRNTRRHTSKIGRNVERERMLFVAAAGAALALLIVILVILTYRPADAGQDSQAAIPQVPVSTGTVSLFAPDRVVRMGTKLSEVRFKEIVWPRNQVPEGAVRDLAEIRNAYAKVNLDPTNPVRHDMVSDHPTVVSLPLTAGMRAVSIEVDETSGLEGHALPGIQVDVTLTFLEEGTLTTKVLVQKAKVLSYGGDITPLEGRTIQPTGQGRPQIQSKTITLEVAPADALQIQTARQLGRLGLIMRTADDDKTPQVTEVKATDIQSGKKGEKNSNKNCSKGTVRIEGKEYVMDCDGGLSKLSEEE